MSLSFPINCNTPEERTGFCYRAMEVLRLIHNGMGKWYKDGLTQNQWNKFPQKVKNRYPYKAKLSVQEWSDFTELFDRIQNRVVQPMLANRELLKESTNWTVDEEDLTNDD